MTASFACVGLASQFAAAMMAQQPFPAPDGHGKFEEVSQAPLDSQFFRPGDSGRRGFCP